MVNNRASLQLRLTITSRNNEDVNIVMVLVGLTLKTEQLDQYDVILSVLPETVAYEGYWGLETSSNKKESKLIFVEKWENRGSYDKYIAWRMEESGETLQKLLAEDGLSVSFNDLESF